MRKKIEKIMDGIQNFLQVVAILLILITIILSFYYNTQYHSYRLLRPQLIQGLLIGITLIGILFILRDSLKKSLNPQKQMGKNKKYLIHGIELITIVLLGVFYAHVIFEVKYKPVLDYIWVSICFSGAIFGALIVFIIDLIIFALNKFYFKEKQPDRMESKHHNWQLAATLLIVICLLGLFYPIIGLANSYPLHFQQDFSTKYEYSDNFNDEHIFENPDYWMEHSEKNYDYWKTFKEDENGVYRINKTAPTDAYSLLHVLGKAIKFQADIKIKDPGQMASFYFLIRWNAQLENIQGGYNFETSRWEINEQKLNKVPLHTLSSKNNEFNLNTWVNVKIIAVGRSVGLYINNKLILSTFCTHITYGRVGFLSQDCSMLIDNVSYSGDGDVNNGVRELFIDKISNNPGFNSEEELDMVELSNGTLILRQSESLYKSNDDGINWHKFHQFPKDFGGRSIIRLPNDDLLCVGIEKNDEGHIKDIATISDNGGYTWGESHQIQENYRDSGSAMNNKLFISSEGRIFFTTTYKEMDLKFGGMRNYYSDDHGKTWIPSSTPLDWDTWGINLQEGKVYELPNGTLRTMMRTDLGVLYESESYDQGVTWGQPRPISELISTRCAFNVENDPVSGESYVFWTYENTTKKIGEQYPRERLALAISRDQHRQNWEYVMDVDDWEDHWYSSRYVNLGIKITTKYIFMNVGVHTETSKDEPKMKRQRFLRIKKDLIEIKDEFPGVHPNDLFTDSWQLRDGDLLI